MFKNYLSSAKTRAIVLNNSNFKIDTNNDSNNDSENSSDKELNANHKKNKHENINVDSEKC